MEESSLPVPYNRLWFGFESLRLYQSLQADLRALTIARLQNIGVFGRLDSRSRFKAIGPSTSTDSCHSTPTTGMDCEPEEISFDSNSITGTPRLLIEYSDNDSIPPPEEAPRHSSFHQTGIGKANSTISSCDSQPDNADSGGNICHLSGPSLHSTSSIFQESSGEIGSGLGQAPSSGPSKQGRIDVVVSQPEEVEWSVSPPVNPLSNNLCGCKQHGLGLLLEQSASPWLLDHRRGDAVDQLEGTEGSSTGPTDFSTSPQLHCTDQDRQHNQLILYQQARRDSLSSSNRACDGSLDMVPSTQDHDSSATHTRYTESDSRLRISPAILQEPMDDQATDFPTHSAEMGPVLNRSICRQDNQAVTKVRIVDAGPGRVAYGCAVHTMDPVSSPLCQSSMELDIASPEQDQAGTSSNCDSGGTLLAECFVVPSSTTVGSGSSLASLTSSGANDLSQDSTSITTAELDALRVATLRQQLVNKNLNAQAVEDLLAQKLAPTGTNLSYRKNQLRFLKWALDKNVSVTSFTPAQLVNFLADMKQRHGLQAATLKTLRAAVSHFHDNPASIRTSNDINLYIDSQMKQAPPMPIHRPTIDITPALIHARSIVSRATTSIKQLQQKLAFLLAMAAFLRPSDLARIPYSSCSILDTGCLTFNVVAPKETRGKRRIIKPFTIHPHASDVELCPVQCFKALRDHPGLAARPSGSQLFVKSNLIDQPLSSSTLSTWLHREFIQLCTAEPGISIRSLASSRALDLGVSKDHIVTLGNWASSSTFEQHYQRNQMAQIDFTSTVLSDPIDHFFDANEDFSLD